MFPCVFLIWVDFYCIGSLFGSIVLLKKESVPTQDAIQILIYGGLIVHSFCFENVSKNIGLITEKDL